MVWRTFLTTQGSAFDLESYNTWQVLYLYALRTALLMRDASKLPVLLGIFTVRGVGIWIYLRAAFSVRLHIHKLFAHILQEAH